MKFKHFAAFVALALGFVVPAHGARFTRPISKLLQQTIPNGASSGSISAANTGTTVATLAGSPIVAVRLPSGAQTVSVDVRTASSWSGALTFAISVDGVNLTVLQPVLTSLGPNPSAPLSSGATGTWVMTIPGGGVLYVYGAAGWSGSATVTLVGGAGGSVGGQLVAGGSVTPWNNSAAAITSPATVVASGGTNIWYIWAFNTSSSTNYYLEFFNAPSSSVTLGVTKPVAWMVVPMAGGWNPNTPTGVFFQTALSVAAVPALYPNDSAAMPGSTVYATIGAH